MARYLVVAHQTVTNPALATKCLAVQDEDPEAEFVLLVPATPVHHLLFLRGDEGDAAIAAYKLADRGRAMFAKHGIKLSDARVGAESPVDAIDEEVKANPGYAGFIISTLPRETSRWLRMDLPRTVGSKYHRPVYHVLAERDWRAADMP